MTAETHAAADPATQLPLPAPAGRNTRGQFTAGNPGGPGRPPKIAHIERELLAFMASVLGPEIWMKVTEAVAQKAMEGNMAAVNWLTKTFLTGALSKSASADAVEISPRAEMFKLGKAEYPEWVRLVQKKIEGEVEREVESAAQQVRQRQASAARETAAPPAPSRAEPTAGDSTVARPAVSAPSRPLVTPESERVRGFRVTKGTPSENSENGDKRSKTEPPQGVSPPAPPPCAGH